MDGCSTKRKLTAAPRGSNDFTAAIPARAERIVLVDRPQSPQSVILAGQVLGRMSWFGLGYSLFRLTADAERLPFPLAPIAAE